MNCLGFRGSLARYNWGFCLFYAGPFIVAIIVDVLIEIPVHLDTIGLIGRVGRVRVVPRVPHQPLLGLTAADML